MTFPSADSVSTQVTFDNTLDTPATRSTGNSTDENNESSTSNHTSACLWPFKTNESPEKLFEQLQDEANSTELHKSKSKQTILDLFEISTELRSTFFRNEELTATFSLLLAGELLFVLPLILNSEHRAQRFARITLLAALLTAFSLLTAGVGVMTLCRGQALLSKSETFTLIHGEGTFHFQSGNAMKSFLIAALATHGIFALGIGLGLLQRQGGVSKSAVKYDMELPNYTPLRGPTEYCQHLCQGHNVGGHICQGNLYEPHRPRKARWGLGRFKGGRKRQK